MDDDMEAQLWDKTQALKAKCTQLKEKIDEVNRGKDSLLEEGDLTNKIEEFEGELEALRFDSAQLRYSLWEKRDYYYGLIDKIEELEDKVDAVEELEDELKEVQYGLSQLAQYLCGKQTYYSNLVDQVEDHESELERFKELVEELKLKT